MTLNARDGVGAALNVAAAGATKFNVQGYTSALSTQLIGAVTLDNDTFSDGDPIGTKVGTISVAMNPTSPSFSGTFAVSGVDAALFQIDGADLELAAEGVEGEYDITIVATATNSAIGNSPKTTAFTITGEAASGYTAQAVHFDGDQWLSIASLTATDSRYFSFAMCVKPDIAFAPLRQFWVVDPDSTFASDSAPAGDGTGVYVNLKNLQDTGRFRYNSADGTIQDGVWDIIIGTFDVGLSMGNKLVKLYINDIDIPPSSIDDTSAAFLASFNGLPFYLGTDNDHSQYIGDMADVRIMPGTSLLTGGDIAVGTRRLFIDANGKPVDPAVATAALGAPCMLFSGNSSTFATNQGTGGAFTLTGTLTNASTSPSD